MGRALIFHGCMTFLRVFQLFTGTGVWFEDKKLCEPDVDDVCSKDCLQPYNNDFVDGTKDVFDIVLRSHYSFTKQSHEKNGWEFHE